jgi:hypothetical protein
VITARPLRWIFVELSTGLANFPASIAASRTIFGSGRHNKICGLNLALIMAKLPPRKKTPEIYFVKSLSTLSIIDLFNY